MIAVKPQIPLVPEQLTADWLSDALGARVDHVDRTDIGAGVGNTSVVIALDMTLRPPGATPAQMVVKMRHPATVERARSFGYNLRETAFYRDIAPTLPPGLAPRCHYIDCDPSGDPSILLLERLQGRSANLVDGCSVDEAATFLEALAGLHAATRASAHLDRWSWLKGFDVAFQGLAPTLPDLVQRFRDGHGDQVSRRTLDIMQAMTPLWIAYLAHSARRPDAGVAMYDSKIENGVFCRRDDGRERVTLIDFALASRSTGAIDVVNCLTGLPVADRRKAERELLAHYHAAQDTTGGAGGLDAFLRDFEDAILVQLVFTALVAAIPDSDPRIRQIRNVLVERALATAEDHDLSGALARWKTL